MCSSLPDTWTQCWLRQIFGRNAEKYDLNTCRDMCQQRPGKISTIVHDRHLLFMHLEKKKSQFLLHQPHTDKKTFKLFSCFVRSKMLNLAGRSLTKFLDSSNGKKLWYYRNKAQKWKIHAVKPYEQSSSHARLQLQSHSMQYSSKWISKLKTQDQMLRVCWLFSCTIQDKIPGWAVNRKRSKQCKTLCSVVMGIMKARIWIWLWMAIRIRKM